MPSASVRGGILLPYDYADHRSLLADHALDIIRLAPPLVANRDTGTHVMAAKLSNLNSAY